MKRARKHSPNKHYCAPDIMRFYNVFNAGQLINAQHKHIMRLQNKLAALGTQETRKET